MPFGCWRSPISADYVAGASVRLGGLVVDSRGLPCWIESRPGEGGRNVIVKAGAGSHHEDILPSTYSARSRVHEYGGGALLAGSNREFYFTNARDQNIYRLAGNGDCMQLTINPEHRYADYSLRPNGRGLYAVTERHNVGGDFVPENFLSLISLDGGAERIVCHGADFYASPRVSPDGRQLAWLQWNLPDMPWQSAALYVAEIDADGSLFKPTLVTGGKTGPAFQCEWDDDGTLYVVAEDGEWSHLYSWSAGTLTRISKIAGELSRPLWALGTRSYVLLGNKRIAAVTVENGEHCLWLIDANNGSASRIDQPHRQILGPVKAGENAIFAIVTNDHAAPAIVKIDMSGQTWLVYRPGGVTFEPGDISVGRTLELEVRRGEAVYAVYYPPQNASFKGPDSAKPPMICSAHGGPTGCADRGLKPKIQYWTSRGFAFLDVDYRGSTGYGAQYRNALDGKWGVLDAADMVAAARAVAERGLADLDALLIAGGSAGGYTALMALCVSKSFRAACVSYGVADLATLLATTHKFEAGYLYGLTGTSEGEVEPVFTERSPLHRAGQIKNPVLLLQGLDDKVVPLEQSRTMARAIERCGIPVSLIEFEGEGHGFRGAETIQRALAAEYAFYAEHLGLPTDRGFTNT